MKKGKNVCVEKGCWNPRRKRERGEPKPLMCREGESAAPRPIARIPDYYGAEVRAIEADRRDGGYIPSWAADERLAAAARLDASLKRSER